MQNISKEYLLLFNTLTELEQSLMELRDRLVRAQQEAEECYLQRMEAATETQDEEA